jgi:hypothetical protein
LVKVTTDLERLAVILVEILVAVGPVALMVFKVTLITVEQAERMAVVVAEVMILLVDTVILQV